ncbi:MAG: F0F1 ATP synthase subunit delta [Colwellia sp.]
MSELTTIARPYAKAAFDFAVEANAIEDWLSQLTFAAQVSQDETVESYLSGGVSVEQATHLFLSVCGEQINSQGQNFLKLMAENHRLLALPQVLTQFCDLKAEHEKTVNVDVTSAVEVTAEQETKISAALEKRLARKVKLNCKVDSSIVSGLIIQAGDMVIDGSIQGKLNRLTTILQS